MARAVAAELAALAGPAERERIVVTKRVVLAYSGGLDTSVAVRWMREEWDVEVVACAVDVGQLKPGEDELIRERARAAGAVEVEVIDARDEFAERLPRARAPAPTRCTRASTRSCPRCRGR